MDKYGVGQDTYCYPGTRILRNRLDIVDAGRLSDAERDLSAIAAGRIEFQPAPYDLAYWQGLHRQLFEDVYAWAGMLRSVDIAKEQTRFCTATRIVAEADRLFAQAARNDWFENLPRLELIPAVAELFGELNMIHPFREGNGRAQRVLFDHLIIHTGHMVDWTSVLPDEWKAANISAVHCDYQPLEAIFRRCIQGRIEPD